MRIIYMISSLLTIAMIMGMTLIGVAIAQDATVPTDPFVQTLLDSIGGLKGLTVVTGLSLVAKLILASFESKYFDRAWDKVSSGWKLVISSLLAYILAVTGLLQTTEITLAGALLHSSVAPLLLMAIHRVWVIFFEKKTPEELLAKAEQLKIQARQLQDQQG